MRILFHEHLFDETPKEYQVEGKTWGEIIDKLQIRGHLSIYDNGKSLSYPECHDIAPEMDTARIMRRPDNSKDWSFILGTAATVAGALLLWTPFGVPLITAGVSMIIGAMVIKPIEDPKDHESYEGGYNINGTSNVNAIGNVPPLVLGTSMVKPPVVGTQISRISSDSSIRGIPVSRGPSILDGGGPDGTSNKQYVRFLFCLGYIGDGCLVTDIRIGDTKFASNSEGVLNGEITVDSGLNGRCEIRQDGTLPELYNKMYKELSVGAEIKTFNDMRSKFFTTVSGCNRVSISVIFQGLFKMDDDGSLKWQSEKIRCYMRAAGTDDPFVQVGNDYEFSGHRNKQYTFSATFEPTAQMIINNPSKQWDVVICKVGIADTSSSKVNATPYLGFIQYRTTREPLTPDMYNKLVFLACEFEASAELQSRLSEVSCIVKNKYHVYSNGNWDSVDYSSNPAAIYRALIKGPYLPRQATDDQIDYATLNSLYDWCEENGRTCNTVISNQVQLRELLNNVLFTCQGSFYLKNGLYSVSFDKVQASPVALLIPKNTNDFHGSKVFGDVIDALDCTFVDKDADYKETTELVLPYGATTYKNKQSQKMFGTDNYEQAVKIARYIMACNKLRPETYTLKIGIEHYSIPRGSRVLVQHDVLKVGICSGRIKRVFQQNSVWQIQIDETVYPQDVTNEYSLVVFKANGDVVTVAVSAPTFENDTLALFENPNGIAEGDLYAFGISGMETIDCVVVGKTLNDDMSCELTLVGYNNDIYSATNAEVPTYNPKVFRGNTFYFGAEYPNLADLKDNLVVSHFGNVFFDFGDYAKKNDATVSEYFENRGTLRELSMFPIGNTLFNFTTTYNESRGKDINWIQISTIGSPTQVFVDNLFWKNTTVCFMIKSWARNTYAAKKILLSYVDTEGKNYFEIYSKDSKYYLASQLVEIDISAFDFAGEHMFTATRDWDEGRIRIWQDKDLIIDVYFKGSDYALSDEPNTSVLENETGTAIIIMEPSLINRGALNRSINLYLFGSAYDGASFIRPYIGDFHIWDWAVEQDDVEEIYDTSMLTMSVDRMTRYLGEFNDVPPLSRLGDSFMWVGASNDLFQNGKVYWLTTGGWSILNNNAEYSIT